jgi:amidase|tara:strand:- start:753 stop:1205 length:453 start_codon:yes stop_codon:yes gene_type:complete
VTELHFAPAHELVRRIKARAALLPHQQWLVWNSEREAMRYQWAAFFEDWDILLCPAAASAAWPHDQAGERHDRTITVNGQQQPTTDQLFWAGFSNVVYLPSTVAPAGLTAEGLPLGLQAVAAEGEDRTAIEFCKLTAEEIAGFQPPPGYD